jgi:MFS family permease
MKPVLRIPIYRRLLLSYALNELAWSVGSLALAVLVYRRTGSALGSTAYFLFSQVLAALAAPLLSTRMDGRPPRLVLPAAYAVEAILFAILAWMTGRFSVAIVLGLAFLDGSVGVASRAMVRTVTTEVLRPRDLLHEGNALMLFVFSLCLMAGPTIGGVVVAVGGTVEALLVNCGLFASMALVLATTSGLSTGAESAPEGPNRLRTALKHVSGDRPVRLMLLLQGAGMLVFAIATPVGVVFTQHTLHAGASGYGVMLSAWGAGAILGSVLFGHWRRRSGRMLLVLSGAALAAGFGVMAIAPDLQVATAGAALGGFGNGLGGGAARTLLQEYTRQRWMGMVMSLNESISMAAPGIGFLLGGIMAAAISPRWALGLAAAGSLAYGLGAWIWLRPSAIGPPPPHAPAPAEPAPPESARMPVRLEPRETVQQ